MSSFAHRRAMGIAPHAVSFAYPDGNRRIGGYPSLIIPHCGRLVNRSEVCYNLGSMKPASWWPAIGVAGAALAVYVATLAPGLTFEHNGADGGDLITAAHTLGVPHPSGYPTYTLLAWLASQLPVGTIAYRANLLSAVCASLAAGLTCLSAQIVLAGSRHRLAVARSSQKRLFIAT